MEDLGHRALVPQRGVRRQAVERRVGARERDGAGAAALARQAEDEREHGDRDVLGRDTDQQAGVRSRPGLERLEQRVRVELVAVGDAPHRQLRRGEHVAGQLDVAAEARGESRERARGERPHRQQVDRLGETGRLTRHGRPQPPVSGFLSSYFLILL